MTKPVRWTLAGFGVLLLLAATAFLSRDWLVKMVAERRIAARTGLRVEMAAFRSGLSEWSVEVQGFRLYNPPEFGGQLLFDVPRFSAVVDPKLAAARQLRFRQLRIHLAELKLVRTREGATNLPRIEQAVSELSMTTSNGFHFAGIDSMCVSIDRISFVDLRQPSAGGTIAVNVRDETVSNLNNSEELQSWIGGLLFRVIIEEAIRSPGRSQGHKWDWLFDWLRGLKM